MKSEQPKFADTLCTIEEIANRLGVCTRTVRRWIGKGSLIAHRFNGLVRISEADFRSFLVAHREH
jgi:excisionase family DNA binding protein